MNGGDTQLAVLRVCDSLLILTLLDWLYSDASHITPLVILCWLYSDAVHIEISARQTGQVSGYKSLNSADHLVKCYNFRVSISISKVALIFSKEGLHKSN